MTKPIIICDDSAMARKQLARSLPADLDAHITFATNGEEALAALAQGLGELLFLDLTMPVMDGFETLEAIKDRGVSTNVVIISGDVQEEAQRRVFALGAVDFIKKPADPAVIADLLKRLPELAEDNGTEIEPPEFTDHDFEPDNSPSDDVSYSDCYQEITNVAMGRAGDLLARLTGEFVQLPIPKVAMLEPSELHMALNFADDEQVSAVCQGFIGTGIAGEALLLFSDTSFESMARLMKRDCGESAQMEVLTDLAGTLLGALLNGLGEQLDLNFSQSYPTVLGRHAKVSDLIAANTHKWQQTLTIEVNYTLENFDIVCDVLLLFTQDSVASINKRLSFLFDLDAPYDQ